jgi:hypothetical protein
MPTHVHAVASIRVFFAAAFWLFGLNWTVLAVAYGWWWR